MGIEKLLFEFLSGAGGGLGTVIIFALLFKKRLFSWLANGSLEVIRGQQKINVSKIEDLTEKVTKFKYEIDKNKEETSEIYDAQKKYDDNDKPQYDKNTHLIEQNAEECETLHKRINKVNARIDASDSTTKELSEQITKLNIEFIKDMGEVKSSLELIKAHLKIKSND